MAYFSHDEGARNDPKLVKVLMRLGQAGKGVYWDLVEMLYEQGGYLPLAEVESYAFALRTDPELVTKLINDFGLFSQDAERFWSESVLDRMHLRTAKSERRAAAGAKGGKARAEREAIAKAALEQPLSNAQAMLENPEALLNDFQAIKGKEIKEKKVNTLPSVEDAASAAAPEPEKKIGEVEYSSHGKSTPERPPAAATPGGAADVGTSVPEVKLTKQRGGKPLPPEPEHFAAFWQAYPRHDDRAGAMAAFRKLPPADQAAAAARAADWLAARPDIVSARGDFRPHPATWLNKQRWLDAPPPALPIQQSVNPQQHAVYQSGAKPGAARHHVPVVTSYGKL
ncbi:MAG: DUF4373 domain-containing protein [Janthinobacterium lividum]